MKTIFSPSDVLWSCVYYPTKSHVVKKNNRDIFFNKALGRNVLVSKPYVASETKRFEAFLSGHKPSEPIACDLWLMIWFTFPKETFFTAKGRRQKIIPDLSNLYEWPQDCMQKAGIIENDSQICSHDWSRRFVGTDTKMEIFLMRFNERPNPS